MPTDTRRNDRAEDRKNGRPEMIHPSPGVLGAFLFLVLMFYRSSIVTTTTTTTTPCTKPRRRPHSIIPGARLSPLSKARRSLVRISWCALHFPIPDETQSEAQSQSVLQLPPLKPHTSLIDDTDPTTSIDITRDFHTEIHDNTARKSLGRRIMRVRKLLP